MSFQLETPRFIIREMTESDAQAMFDMNNDPEVIRYTGDPPFESLEATSAFLASYYSRQKPGTGRWGIEERTTRQMIGWTGIKFEEESGLYDIGYRLPRMHWGKGIATETSAACVRYAFDALNIEKLVGRVMHDNKASIRVLEKLGLVYEGEDSCKHHPAQLYAMDRQRYASVYR